ncbi:hypothetical protein CHRY9390_02820 [Chryseobacterium aquaeductus]|uniref:HNH endonuclease n=1 Tax=Chryseobacterium aquaeductus TaxID=2675056 RepID=A0A9N8QTH8_9FLAO|nr:hypothetical protein [Chryseobacterium aquaeductus]CAA7332099.1 hypothetical protein CHRY9390_02820 [Chryseobacterium potabilaquae]CAD7814529.1 hypothetical protein CHRY9390_02820 [Chryseobacterium aquaeductus]
MIRLKEISSETLEWYYLEMKDKIDCSCLSECSKKFLTEDIIKQILTKEPLVLLGIHNVAPCELKNKNIIEKVFDYDKFISKSQSTSYEISKKIGINTCTYCNRNYTLTIVEIDKKTGKENNSTRISRPQFDHYFSQKDYPLLALSIYNLIPSCNICNSSIKGSKELSLKNHLHPYIEVGDNTNENFKFSYDFDETLSKFSVKINCEEKSKIKETLDFFKIKEVYNAHSNFELKDLYDLRYKYSQNYLDILCNKTFEGLNLSQEEAYRMVFGIEVNKDDYHKRPFSKFKHDIIEELKKSF